MNGRPAFLRGDRPAVRAGDRCGRRVQHVAAVLAGGQASPSPVSPSGSLVAVGSSAPPASPTPSPTQEIGRADGDGLADAGTHGDTRTDAHTQADTQARAGAAHRLPGDRSGRETPCHRGHGRRSLGHRPQSGFDDASIVWQAPAEGGIPRYMMLFQDGLTPSVGPVRSARFSVRLGQRHSLYVPRRAARRRRSTSSTRRRGTVARSTRSADEFRWAAAPATCGARATGSPRTTCTATASTCASSPSASGPRTPRSSRRGRSPLTRASPSPQRAGRSSSYLYNRIVYHYEPGDEPVSAFRDR